MVDYTRLARTAERLIRKNGREIIFKKPNPSALPVDPNKPWNGKNPSSPMILLPLRAVFAPPNTVRQFGLNALGEGSEILDLFSFVQQIFILFPGENDITQYPIVEDRGKDYNLIGYQLLRPADNNLLAFVGTRR